MIAAAQALAGHLAEATTHESEGGVPAWVLGSATLAILLLLLFVITRFNRDR